MTNEEALKVLDTIPTIGEQVDALEMAIEALEQEPCEDCISRQAVLDCFKKWQPYMATRLLDFEKELSELPSVTPQPRWIPVSEKLPEKNKYENFYKCLIAVRYKSNDDVCDIVAAYFDGKHFYTNRYDRCFIEGVKAWRPLPESYRIESEVGK